MKDEWKEGQTDERKEGMGEEEASKQALYAGLQNVALEVVVGVVW